MLNFKLKTMKEILINIFYFVLAVFIMWHLVTAYINNKRQVKHSIEIHKLNIEKTQLEIELLKRRN